MRFARLPYFDRSGAPMDPDEWAERFEHDLPYRRVALDEIGPVALVSTMWFGFDLRILQRPDDRPLIFETSTFVHAGDSIIRRYATESEAVEGHREAVELARRMLDELLRLRVRLDGRLFDPRLNIGIPTDDG